eukprot:463522_1
MLQALQDGPITCGMQVTPQFEAQIGNCDVYEDPCTHCILQDHDISIVGYGTDSETNTNYWIIRNSWGTWWGCNGYIKVVRGINNMGLEEACAWAMPADEPQWVNKSTENQQFIEQIQHKIGNKGKQSIGCTFIDVEKEKLKPQLIKSALPSTYINIESLPSDFSWGNYETMNMLTTARNQHIPQYCGSCWAMAPTSALSDRLNIIRYRNESYKKDIFPEINLSPQVLINVNELNGDCNGGYAGDAMKYLYDIGIPDETCQNYMAINNPHGNNNEYNICYTCDSDGECYKVKPNKIYKVE